MLRVRAAHGPLARIVLALLTALAAGALLVSPGQAPTARAADPPFVDWPALLPGLTDEYDPSSENNCVAGRPTCITAVIREMERRFGPLGRSCHHNAVFALAYLRTTQTYDWAQRQDGYFQERNWVNHYAAVFAKYYFRAYDDWATGRTGSVPAAWRIAFDNARDRKVTGSGNLLLGMSGHINRDLPYVLAGIGMATPAGTSRKVDHNKVNHFLNTVMQPLLLEASARFDPDTINVRTPFGVGYTALFQQVAAWRELAWRNAELLVTAPTPAARALVANTIEAQAATTATGLVTANSYLPGQSSAARDAFCAANNGAAAPMAYAFGTPRPYGR
jgi:hypothetical protein